MKFSKKILPMVLAVVMIPTMSISIFADDTTSTTTSSAVSTTTVDISNHTFAAYQIFTGDLNGEKQLSNIKWGTGVNASELLKALKGATTFSTGVTFGNCSTAADVAGIVGGFTDNSDNAKAFAKLVSEKLTDTKTVSSTLGKANLPAAGYYLIVDTTSMMDNNKEKDDALNLSLLEVSAAGEVEVRNKTSKTTLIKKVKDVNDSENNSETGWQDSADYDIGDHIPYQLTATLGDLTNYDTYKLVFHDEMTHLTLDKAEGEDSAHALTVKVGNKTLGTSEYVLNPSSDGKTFTVTINDVKALGGTTGTLVTVDYYAILDSDATIGSTGNPNTSYLEYSNNPNNTGDGRSLGKTPEDKNIVFTYKIVANKVNQNKEKLKGAAFELQKKNSSGNYEFVGVVGATKTSENTYTQTEDQKNQEPVFAFSGIDDGDYKLVEVVTPKGYNTIAPMEFKVAATHEPNADTPRLTALTIRDTEGNVISEGEDKVFTTVLSDGSATVEVVNKSGSILPETGGIGTTIFYIVGVVLVLGAGILLVTKKRMNADK